MAIAEGDLALKLNGALQRVGLAQTEMKKEQEERRKYLKHKGALATYAEAAIRAYGRPPVDGDTPPGLRPPHLVTPWVVIHDKNLPFSELPVVRLQGYSSGQSGASLTLGEISRVDCQVNNALDGSVVRLFTLGHGAEPINALNRTATIEELKFFRQVVSYIDTHLDGGV